MYAFAFLKRGEQKGMRSTANYFTPRTFVIHEYPHQLYVTRPPRGAKEEAWYSPVSIHEVGVDVVGAERTAGIRWQDHAAARQIQETFS